jgi:hypothetical protein
VPAVSRHLKSRNLPEKALLVLDSVPYHPNECQLKKGNIKAAFLPANITPLIQPMDHGVI